jgi:methionine-R-sulfoxide reductase
MRAARQWVLGIGAALGLVASAAAAEPDPKNPAGVTNAASPPNATSPASAPAWNPQTFEKPSDAELRRALTPLEYAVTQRADTERPFDNRYWKNEQAGIYVDVVSGEPLFSSLDKFDSGTGWPSFTRPLAPANIKEIEDRQFFTLRTEVRSAHADSHLGHVFDDGPPPAGQRWCMNSAALRFIPLDRLAAEGYAQFLPLFEQPATVPHAVKKP